MPRHKRRIRHSNCPLRVSFNRRLKMKTALLFLCLAVASCAALPTQPSRASVLDLLEDLENVVHEDGRKIIEKMINVIHHVESGVLQVRSLVPKAYEKIHQEVDDCLAALKKVTDEVQELLARSKAQFGFDLLSGLTELSGGTKLSTVLNLLSVADKAHKVMNDAKEFVPNLDKTLDKIQARVEDHVSEFAKQVIRDLGLQNLIQNSVVDKISELFNLVKEEGHSLILDLVNKIQLALDLLKYSLPDEKEKVKKAVKEIEQKIHELVEEIEKSLAMKSYGILDIAGDVTGGTQMSTVFKVMSLVDKFNRVMQDVRTFGPNAETVMHHSVQKVAESFQVFLNHASTKLFDI